MIGILIWIIFIVSAVPQTIKLIKTKSSKDISLRTYLLTFVWVALSVYVAYINNAIDLVISNWLSLWFLLLNIWLIIKYRDFKTKID